MAGSGGAAVAGRRARRADDFARIGMMRALNTRKPAPEPEPRRKRAKV
jgi:hypothetical protein